MKLLVGPFELHEPTDKKPQQPRMSHLDFHLPAVRVDPVTPFMRK